MKKRKSSLTQGNNPATLLANAKEREKGHPKSKGLKRKSMNGLMKITWILNIIVAAGMVMSAYSTYINPADHALISLAGLFFPFFLLANVFFILLWLFFSTRHSLLSFAACLCCIMPIRTYIPFNPGSGAVPDKAAKLLSYNVMGFASGTDESDRKALLTYLQKSESDIICLQEAYGLTPEEESTYFKDYPYKKFTPIGMHSQNALACFSKCKILSCQKLDNQTEINGSVAYQIKVGPDTILLINNHLQSNRLTVEDKNKYKEMLKEPSKQSIFRGLGLLKAKLPAANRLRGPQADTVAQLIRRQLGRNVWVCGDFNDSPISYTHRVIADNLTDAFVESGSGIGISYNQKGFPFRIDNILISQDWRSFRCTVDRSIHISDHYPIWCFLKRNRP